MFITVQASLARAHGKLIINPGVFLDAVLGFNIRHIPPDEESVNNLRCDSNANERFLFSARFQEDQTYITR